VARIDPEAVDDRSLTRVFIAPTMAEARRAEDLLTAEGIEYAVQAEALSRTLFGSPRYWAAFYVARDQARSSSELLAAAGLEEGLVAHEVEEDGSTA
jgi:hypothetical protein